MHIYCKFNLFFFLKKKGILFIIDCYSLRSKEPKFLLDLLEDPLFKDKKLDLQPNFCFSKALAVKKKEYQISF